MFNQISELDQLIVFPLVKYEDLFNHLACINPLCKLTSNSHSSKFEPMHKTKSVWTKNIV